jgi:hypothetical protein
VITLAGDATVASFLERAEDLYEKWSNDELTEEDRTKKLTKLCDEAEDSLPPGCIPMFKERMFALAADYNLGETSPAIRPGNRSGAQKALNAAAKRKRARWVRFG